MDNVEKMENVGNMNKVIELNSDNTECVEGNEKPHTLRDNQLDITTAKRLTIDMMLSEGNFKTKHSLSKADIILIFTVYGSLDKFYSKYMRYVKGCIDLNYSYCQPPHYFLKYQIR